jgi:hypothetical protein
MLTFDTKMVEYKLMGHEKLRDALPFQEMPENI